MTANSRLQFESNSASWDSSPDVRIRPVSGTTRNERAIFDLQAAEIQYHVDAANDIKENGTASSAIQKLQSKSSPLDRVNRLLLQSNLPVKTIIDSGELKAQRNGNIYSISRMSDGERTALILIADVIAAKNGACFLIDEPELHLHRSIVVPLIAALMAERPDCAMIVSTHELSLPSEHPNCSIILVRGCVWSGGAPRAWDFDEISDAENIPIEVRIDLLGSRRKILFVEGKSTSLDQPLYALIFPRISIRQRETCNEVRRAVVGLRQVQSHHHAEVFGLVDNDSMEVDFQEKLLNEGIYALPMFSVESIYYSIEVLSAVAERQATTLGVAADDLLRNCFSKALETLNNPGKAEHLAARISERQMRDKILANIPDRKLIVASGSDPINISVVSPYATGLNKIKALISDGNLTSIINGYPVRETGILGDLAKGLRFLGEIDYEKAALSVINMNDYLKSTIKNKLGALSNQLD
ncbi:DUF4435 domain-containing protein [Methylobacterium sp. J-077]|uniref:DUF4435 domain-containing protein n=1 Tax=Methylobacterium sp. J-077 TaxID=2836656 RepID=UPI00391969B6